MKSEMFISKKSWGIFSILSILALLLIATPALAKKATSKKHPTQEFFDDFNYTGTDDPLFVASDWVLDDQSGGAGSALIIKECASIIPHPDDPKERVLKCRVTSTGKKGKTERAQVHTTGRFFEGTFAVRALIKNKSDYGISGDSVIYVPFHMGGTLRYDLDPDYGELDFEYLPGGQWAKAKALRGKPMMHMNTWETYKQRPFKVVNTGTQISKSFAGWHTFVIQVADGKVKYYIDGELKATHGGKFYPEKYMKLYIHIWLFRIMRAKDKREWSTAFDWVWCGKDVIVAPDEVEALVRDFRASKINYRDTYPKAPSEIKLSKISVSQTAPIGTVVGTFTTVDSSKRAPYAYDLTEWDGSKDNKMFKVDGDKLKTAVAFDDKTPRELSIRMQSVSKDGPYHAEKFKITITK